MNGVLENIYHEGEIEILEDEIEWLWGIIERAKSALNSGMVTKAKEILNEADKGEGKS